MQDWAKQELLLFIHLNMAVLCLGGLTADRLGLGPGFEDLAQWARNWQACHTDPIWKDTMVSHSQHTKSTGYRDDAIITQWQVEQQGKQSHMINTTRHSMMYYKVLQELFCDEVF